MLIKRREKEGSLNCEHDHNDGDLKYRLYLDNPQPMIPISCLVRKRLANARQFFLVEETTEYIDTASKVLYKTAKIQNQSGVMALRSRR